MLTQTDLDVLDRAIATGVLEVRYGDRTVRYQTTAELVRARAMVAAQLATAPTAATTTSYASHVRD